jgi:hypothetical protein
MGSKYMRFMSTFIAVCLVSLICIELFELQQCQSYHYHYDNYLDIHENHKYNTNSDFHEESNSNIVPMPFAKHSRQTRDIKDIQDIQDIQKDKKSVSGASKAIHWFRNLPVWGIVLVTVFGSLLAALILYSCLWYGRKDPPVPYEYIIDMNS